MRNLKTKNKVGILFLAILFVALFVSTNASATYTNDLIPTMTSNTAPSGIASASSELNADYQAWKAFNNIINASPTDCWATPAGQTTGWLSYEFLTPKTITKYTLIGQTGYQARSPKNWTFEGWNETTSQWLILDTQNNITGWSDNVKKEFTFTNSTAYKKYRINITANNGDSQYLAIAEMEMMESLTTVPSAPTNLTATAGDTQANLVWDAVYDATSYNVKRSTTAGGSYTTVATNVYATNYTDPGLTNGVTYYYVVTAINAAGESGNSNEVSVTPTAPPATGNRSLLVITLVNGSEKEYDLSAAELNAFTTWYNNRASGTGSPYYTMNKNYNVGPFLSRKDNLVFDKIVSFEINEY